MSLKVDTNQINIEDRKFEKLIKNYIDNSDDIYYELSKLDSYWKDEDKILFDEKVKKDKINNILIVDNLYKIRKLYNEVQNIYDKKHDIR